MRLYAHYQHISHVGGRLSGTLPRGLGCHWDVTLAVYSTGHSSGLPAEEDSERRFSAQPLVADFENVSGVGDYGNDGSEGGGGGGGCQFWRCQTPWRGVFLLAIASRRIMWLCRSCVMLSMTRLWLDT